MECSKEEFLLMLRNWQQSSKEVTLMLSAGKPPLGNIFMARVSGFILNIDEEAGFFAIATDTSQLTDEDFATVGIEGCNFAWGDERTVSAGAGIMKYTREIDEVLTLATPTGLKIAVLTSKK